VKASAGDEKIQILSFIIGDPYDRGEANVTAWSALASVTIALRCQRPALKEIWRAIRW